jgi:hypothetical protein
MIYCFFSSLYWSAIAPAGWEDLFNWSQAGGCSLRNDNLYHRNGFICSLLAIMCLYRLKDCCSCFTARSNSVITYVSSAGKYMDALGWYPSLYLTNQPVWDLFYYISMLCCVYASHDFFWFLYSAVWACHIISGSILIFMGTCHSPTTARIYSLRVNLLRLEFVHTDFMSLLDHEDTNLGYRDSK